MGVDEMAMMTRMKTYTDDHIRAVLALMVRDSSYSKVEAALGYNRAQLNRIVHGKESVTEGVAAALGFVPCDRKWTRK